MLSFVKTLPWPVVILLCLTLGLAPFTPEPHIAEKIRMLSTGTLNKPVDIFDLCFHSVPFIIFLLKIYTTLKDKK